MILEQTVPLHRLPLGRSDARHVGGAQRAVLHDQPRDHALRLVEREADEIVHEAHLVLAAQLDLERHARRVLADETLQQPAVLGEVGHRKAQLHRERTQRVGHVHARTRDHDRASSRAEVRDGILHLARDEWILEVRAESAEVEAREAGRDRREELVGALGLDRVEEDERVPRAHEQLEFRFRVLHATPVVDGAGAVSPARAVAVPWGICHHAGDPCTTQMTPSRRASAKAGEEPPGSSADAPRSGFTIVGIGASAGGLAALLTASHPGSSLLFMSGQPANLAASSDAAEQGGAFIRTPFSFDAFATSVRRVLDEA